MPSTRSATAYRLRAKGMSWQQIADRMGLAKGTVRVMVQREEAKRGENGR